MTIRDRLLALELVGIKLGLANMRALAAALGHPERAYPTVHVAGTNGKGSVCAMIEHALRAAGHRTGLYTSPHLDRLEERVAVNGVPLDEAAFDRAARAVFDAVAAARSDGRLTVTPTFFEVTTALAFEAFREARVEVAVIEVGLGGRFDATNIVSPLVTAITSIALDHERHLGTTLAAIAAEKAGIAKAGVPVIAGPLPPEARAVIAQHAADVGAPLVPAAGAVEPVEVRRGRASVRVPSAGHDRPIPLALLGRHQVDNAATAVRTLETMAARGLAVPPGAIEAGLAGARWAARLEWLRVDGGVLLIDAAHNPAGAAALAGYLDDEGGPRPPIVLAAMQDKDVDGMVRPLARVAARFVATSVPLARALAADVLAARIRAAVPEVPVSAVPDAREAVRAALAADGRAVAAGSIYFVGPLRARLLESGATPI